MLIHPNKWNGLLANNRKRLKNQKLTGPLKNEIFDHSNQLNLETFTKQPKNYEKGLSELTKEDWNRLFPIELVDHNPEWRKIYDIEKESIIEKIGNGTILRVEHFGSSSIPAIKSKPYIDMMIEIPTELLFDSNLISKFEELGYSYFKVPARENIDAYMSFGKGYNTDGKKEQIFHIHMCPKENVMWKQIAFRDYLNSNPKRAKLYENLKLELASEYKNDRGSYVLGKTDFINETLDIISGKASA